MISEFGGDFKLVLDFPHLPYRPGDTVSGGILKVPPNENVERIQLLLTGEAKYTVTPNRGGHGSRKDYTAIILSRTFDVVQNAAGEWRFDIVLPTTTERNSDPGNSYLRLSASQPESVHFATEDEHPLPPTKPYDVAEEGTNLHTSSIIYGLRPCAVKQQGADQPVRIVRPMLMLWITPPCPPTETEPATGMGSKVTETMSVPNKNAKKGPTSTSTPTFDFEVAFSAPPYLHVWDTFSINIDVALSDPDDQDPSQAPIPVTLLELHVLINCTWHAYSTTSTRLNNLTPAQWQPVTRKAAHTFPDFSASSSTATFHTTALGPLDHYVIPDLKTFHLSTAHELYILALFSCNKQKRLVRANLPVRILPKPRRATDGGESRGFVGGPQDTKEDWGTVVLYPAAALPLVEPGDDEDPIMGLMDSAHTGLEVANMASSSCACCSVM